MTDLQHISTKELVMELSRRDGVARFDVEPHGQTVEICIQENGTNVVDEMTTGPAIVLRVED